MTTQLRTKKSRGKRITLKRSEVVNMVNAVFRGDEDNPGWVSAFADAKGRECIEALFPNVPIPWADHHTDVLPPDWRILSINVPAAATTETRLPLEITDGVNLDEAAPDALAFLLAYGVCRQGGRCALFRGDKIDIHHPQGVVQ
jgi:hypothetical protein